MMLYKFLGGCWLFSCFALKEARNASLTAHSRKRRANDGHKQVQSPQPTPDRSDEDDDDDGDNSADYPDDDDDFWDDEESSTMRHLFEDMVLSCTYRGVLCR